MSTAAPAITFHTGVHDPVLHGLRVIRKSLAQGLGVLVLAPSEAVATLDEQLWVAEPGGFVPHVRLDEMPPTESPATGAPGSALLRLSSVWLQSHDDALTAPTTPAGREVLVNLGCPVPQDVGPYSRIVEVVGTAPEARVLGQNRWREYRSRGHNPAHHAV